MYICTLFTTYVQVYSLHNICTIVHSAQSMYNTGDKYRMIIMNKIKLKSICNKAAEQEFDEQPRSQDQETSETDEQLMKHGQAKQIEHDEPMSHKQD